MKKLLLQLLILLPFALYAQTPLYYQSNYVRIVQLNSNQNLDTLVNPYTGGMNNPMFSSIDLDGDGILDLFVFDRDVEENQFLNFKAVKKNSIQYNFTPYYESAFPRDLNSWGTLADFNNDRKPDIFTHSTTNSTGIKLYKNTSFIDPVSKKFALQFQVVSDGLNSYDASNNAKNIDVPLASNPVFVDVDHDGYLDIVSYDVSLNGMQFYRNQGKNADSAKYYYTDRCWGKFEESGNHYYTPWNCLEFSTYDPKKHKQGSAHGYSAVCALDIDGDGDMDMLIGDGGNDSLCMLRNGKTTNKNGRDSMTNTPSSAANNNYPIDERAILHTMPMASNLDIDNDGIKDLVIAAGQPTDTETYHSSRLNNIWYYQNRGDTVTPVFKITAKNFLQNTTVDWGVNSAPCFIDVDKDGRKDLIVAVRDGGAVHGYSHLVLYLNKAGKKPGANPSFLYQSSDYLNLSSYSAPVRRPVPAPYYNGKDSLTDLIMGNDSGRIMYYKDRSSDNKKPADFKLAQTSLKYLVAGKLTPIDVGYNSSPTAVDINKDGKTDLLIGASDGRISYYRCLGFGPAPDFVPYFELVTGTFGGINAIVGSNRQSAPCVADLNRNGKPDLIVGDYYGRVFYYPDFDTINPIKTDSSSLVYDYRTKARSEGKLFSTWVIPAVMNMDQDSIPDIMLGCRRGGLFFLGSVNNGFEPMIKSGINENEAAVAEHMILYPNPAQDQISLKYENNAASRHADLIISDIMGRQLISHPFTLVPGSASEKISTGELQNGIYIVNVIAGNKLLRSEKVVIRR